jgi:hypothetical protein
LEVLRLVSSARFFGHAFFGRHRREWQSTAGPELEERTTDANDTVKAKAN